MSTRYRPDERWLRRLAPIGIRFSESYNDYELVGADNLPRSGGALMVFYHGLVPIDFWYLGLHLYWELGRPVCGLVDTFLMKTPFMAKLTQAFGGIEADYQTALKVLKSGVIVGVSPGGVREALKGEEMSYQLVWGGRKGFARLALEAGVPIIPGFTRNVEALYRSPGGDQPFFKKIYEKTRLPIAPIVGLGPLPFPVKLTSYLGEPIQTENFKTPEELVEATRLSIEALIQKHQPDSAEAGVFQGISENRRFRMARKLLSLKSKEKK